MSVPSPVAVVNADQFTSEEVIQEAIKRLIEKKSVLEASIQVLEKRLRFLRCLSVPISKGEQNYMQSLKASCAHSDPVLIPIRPSPHYSSQ